MQLLFPQPQARLRAPQASSMYLYLLYLTYDVPDELLTETGWRVDLPRPTVIQCRARDLLAVPDRTI